MKFLNFKETKVTAINYRVLTIFETINRPFKSQEFQGHQL